MTQNKNKIFASIGFLLNEFKKSFFVSFIFFVIAFGIAYLFSIISFTFYLILNSKATALTFVILTILFALISLIILFSIFNRIKKISLVKVINYEIKSKDRKILLFVDSFLEEEQKRKNKALINRFGLFLVSIVFILLIIFLLLGLWYIITSLWLKIIVFLILGLLFIPFFMFITRYCFYSKSLKELLFSYKLFAKHFGLLLITFVISIIPITIFCLLYYLLPQHVVLDYLFLFLFILSIELAIYYHFFVISFIYLEESSK